VPPATLAPAFTRNQNESNTSFASKTWLVSISETTTTKDTHIFNFFKPTTTVNHFSKNTNSSKDPNSLDSKEKESQTCGHMVTTYIIPSVLHLIAYIIGFIYFRINENEQLYALMEKVFLAVNQTLKVVSQDRVIKRLK
jgi:hypothetical protein